jgi:hypothetical protein
MLSRRAVCTALFVAMFSGPTFARPASALEAKLTEIRAAGGSLRASLEIGDLFPEKFQAVLEAGGAIHLRLQIELWQTRPVWDKLVQPAVVSVFRIILDRTTREVRVSDAYGEVSRQPAWQEPLSLALDLGRADAIDDNGQYYVRVLATLGTIAEKEGDQAGRVVFGDDNSTVSIAGVGKLLFHAVLQVNDYLQSVSAEARTHRVSGRAMKAGVKLQ